MKFQCQPRLSQSRCYSQPFHLSTSADVRVADIVSKNYSVLNVVIPCVVGANLNLAVPLSALPVVALKTFFLARSQSECNDGNNEKSFHGFWFLSDLIFFGALRHPQLRAVVTYWLIAVTTAMRNIIIILIAFANIKLSASLCAFITFLFAGNNCQGEKKDENVFHSVSFKIVKL